MCFFTSFGHFSGHFVHGHIIMAESQINLSIKFKKDVVNTGKPHEVTEFLCLVQKSAEADSGGWP